MTTLKFFLDGTAFALPKSGGFMAQFNLKFSVAILCMGLGACNANQYEFVAVPEPMNTGLGGGGPIGVPSVTCSQQLQDLNVSAKVLFVVDTSGSNLDDGAVKGTDHDKAYRAGSIQKFFNDYGGKPNFSWGFITFSNGGSKSWIGGFLSNQHFSNTASEMQTSLTEFLSNEDYGDTPYSSAISKAITAIQNDTGRDKDTKYIVVFLSDGLPTDSSHPDLVNKVKQLRDTVPGQVSFNTIFYGTPSEGGAVLMKSMADAGGGQFLDTNLNAAGRSFPISSVIQVPGLVCTPN